MKVTTNDGEEYRVLSINVPGQSISPDFVQSFDIEASADEPRYVMKKDDSVWVGLDKDGNAMTDETRTRSQIVDDFSGIDTIKVQSNPNTYQIIYSLGH